MSKLRRLFILIEQNIKTVLKDHIRNQITRYREILIKRKAKSIDFKSFKQFTINYVHSDIN
jgi:hypothetical protein